MKENNFFQNWYNKLQAAEYLVVSTRTIRRLEIAGVLTAYCVPGTRSRRYRRDDLDGLMESM